MTDQQKKDRQRRQHGKRFVDKGQHLKLVGEASTIKVLPAEEPKPNGR